MPRDGYGRISAASRLNSDKFIFRYLLSTEPTNLEATPLGRILSGRLGAVDTVRSTRTVDTEREVPNDALCARMLAVRYVRTTNELFESTQFIFF